MFGIKFDIFVINNDLKVVNLRSILTAFNVSYHNLTLNDSVSLTWQKSCIVLKESGMGTIT